MLYGIKDCANLTIKKKSDGSVFLYTPYSNVTTNEWSADQVYAMAKGVRAIRWDHNKQGTLQVDCDVFDLKWLAMLAGSDWVTGATEVLKREVLSASATNTITLSSTPTTGSLAIFKLDSDKVSHLEEQTEGDPATNINEYSITSDVITLNTTTGTEGTLFVAYYMTTTEETSQTLEIKFDKYPENFEVFGDTMITPKGGGANEFVQIHYPDAKPMPNHTITMDAANPTSLSITFDLFPDAEGNMAVYKKI